MRVTIIMTMDTTSRPVKHTITPQMVIEGAGVKLRRSFGPTRSNPLDPFLLFDNFAFNNPQEGPIAGFPTHPHRGIETVTYMLEGSVRHRDSLGNVGLIGAGDVQWMTAGRGIMHEEMPRRGPSGLIKGFQLWVNLPAAQKMSPPRYQEVKENEISVVKKDGATVRVVAGEFAGVRGPVTDIAAQPLYMDVTLDAGATFSLPTPRGHTVVAYVFEGAGLFGKDATNTEAVKMLVFGDGDSFTAQASPSQPVRFMLMAGAPFKEAIVPYGPFVMNTEAEIYQAFEDLRTGNFVK